MEKILFGKPVSPTDYIPRENIEASMLKLISDRNDIELIGANRMGKTALCRYMASQLSTKADMVVSFIDLSHLRVPRFRCAVAKIIDSRIDFETEDNLDEYIGADEIAVDKLIEFANSVNGDLLIIIDEMDIGLQRKGLYFEWNASLRLLDQIFYEKNITNISFVRVLTSPADYYEEIHTGHVISKSVGRGYVMSMPNLNVTAAKEFFSSLISDECRIDGDFAIRYAGGHPFLLDCLAYEAEQLDLLQPNYKHMLEDVYRQSESFYKDLFEFIVRKDNYWKTLTSMLISTALMQVKSIVPPVIDSNDRKFDLDEMEIKDLKSFGVLIENNGELELFSPLYAWWLSRNVSSLLQEDSELSNSLITYFGVSDLKTLLTNVKNGLAIAGGISALL